MFDISFDRDTKLYIEVCTKSQVAIHVTMSDNTHEKSYQLKLNDMNCHVNCHTRFGVSFGT